MSNYDEINQHIYALNYNPDEVLVFNGNTVSNIIPHSDSFEDGDYIVKTRTKNTIDGTFDVCVPNAFQSIAYPGGLLMANSKLVDGCPQPLVAERAPAKVTIDLPGMGTSNSITVDNPIYANVKAAIDTLLNKWYDQYGGSYEIPCNFQFNSDLVEDEKQMSLKFGCDVGYLTEKLGIDFNAIYNKKKSTYMAQYKQIFYTVSIENPCQPADVFDENVTWDQLSNKGVSDKTPPMYVHNVQYGRQIYLKFESNMSDLDLEATLNATISLDNGIKIKPDAKGEFDSKCKNISCTIIAMGGNSSLYSGLLTSENVINEINSIIFENTKLSAKNPAYPICYLPAFLKDNATWNVVGHSEYVTESTAVYRSGVLNLEHTGAYVAKWYIYWDEQSYDENGNVQYKACEWGENGDHKTAKYTTQISLKGNTRNIHIKAQGATGLVWDKWHTPIDKEGLAMVPERKAKIWGTTLNQKGSVDPE